MVHQVNKSLDVIIIFVLVWVFVVWRSKVNGIGELRESSQTRKVTVHYKSASNFTGKLIHGRANFWFEGRRWHCHLSVRELNQNIRNWLDEDCAGAATCDLLALCWIVSSTWYFECQKKKLRALLEWRVTRWRRQKMEESNRRRLTSVRTQNSIPAVS